MTDNKFLSLGVNALLNVVNKTQYYYSFQKLISHEFLNIFRNMKSKNPDITEDGGYERKLHDKTMKANLRVLEFRLKLLGSNNFCAWGIKELNEGKKSPFDFYGLILREKIEDNQNYNGLKNAICNALRKNGYRGFRSSAIFSGLLLAVNPNDYPKGQSYLDIIEKLENNNEGSNMKAVVNNNDNDNDNYYTEALKMLRAKRMNKF